LSRELVPISAAEIEQNLLGEARDRISEAQVQRQQRLLEESIVAHYEQRATNLLFRIWRECGRRSGHEGARRLTRDDPDYESSSYGSSRRFQCDACAAPVYWDRLPRYLWLRRGWQLFAPEHERVKRGLAELGRQLRTADQQAGIEWVPGA
jgi:hypothetical protein